MKHSCKYHVNMCSHMLHFQFYVLDSKSECVVITWKSRLIQLQTHPGIQKLSHDLA